MADQLGGAWALADVIRAAVGDGADSGREVAATVTRVDASGVPWVLVDGSEAEVPANGSVLAEASPGQRVLARVRAGRLSIVGSTSSPAVGATHVERVVSPVAEEAQQAGQAAQEAMDEAVAAHEAAESAEADAARAAVAADSAQQSADEASASAASASASASAALTQLSVVEDVAGTLAWISEHGSFVATEDSSVVEGRTYFAWDGADYAPVVPAGTEDPCELGWYVLDVTDSQAEYVMSHLAVTSRGLWVLPNGIGDAASPQVAAGYKLLLSATGYAIYDASGTLVQDTGPTGTTYAEGVAWHLGGEDAYILYTPATADAPASITIGGGHTSIPGEVEIGGEGRTLSEALADIRGAAAAAEEAVQAADEAVQTANDVPIVTLSSTNGTVFKRNVGVSTTIIATVFTPGGRIDDRATLAERFGAGAYLQWGWRDVVTDADHVLTIDDPRISQGGFALAVSPDDIDTQAVITCSLVC